MSKPEIKQGVGYCGNGGEVRHVIIISKVGRGHRILWDSVSSLDPEYYGALYSGMKHRPHGAMAMRDFEKWVMCVLTEK